MRRFRYTQSAAGFTLVELLIVILFIAMLVALGMPALQQMIHRSRLEGAAREAGVAFQAARLEAIKGSIPTALRFDPTDSTIRSWVDPDANGSFDDGEEEFGFQTLPPQVTFSGPGAIDGIVGFQADGDGSWITFNTDGSIELAEATEDTCGIDVHGPDPSFGYGCLHFGDQRSNFIQLSIGPRATAGVALRKWDDSESEWRLAGEEGHPWKWH